MSLPRYPEYKESGVDWLGEVPSHWVTAPLKRGYDVCLGKMLQTESSSVEDSLLPYLRAANIQWSGVDTNDIKTMWFSPRDRNQLKLRNGDLLVSEGGDVGRSALWKQELDDCYVQNSVNRIRGKGNNSTKFLYYWMATVKAKGYIDVLCNKSTIAHFTAEKVAEVPVPFPPEPEQTAIAAFLDRETAKIDGLIAEQEKLIALLAEKRKATISHAVTKGQNPDAPMKDSGVAWLGEVPVHWESKRVKHIKSPQQNAFVDGPFGSNLKSEHFIDDGDVYVIESNFATQNKIAPAELKTISFAHFETVSRSEVFPGDIVIAKIGAQFGKASILPALDKRALVSGNSLKLTVNNSLCTTIWAHLQLVNLKNSGEIDLLSNGSAQPALSLGSMNNLPFLLPPLEEQESIIEFLDVETTRLDNLTTEATLGIVLLKERRSALISAAVTGKIDVRHIAEAEAA